MSTAVADRPPAPSSDDIERRAVEWLREHDLDRVPVDLLALADRLGVAVRAAPMKDAAVAGGIAKHAGEVTILVNADDPPAAKRFTVAHELAHLALHLGDVEDGGGIVDRDVDLYRGPAGGAGPGQAREAEANEFATALLMPAPSVRALWPELRSVRGMAELFNVTHEAMGRRVTRLGLT